MKNQNIKTIIWLILALSAVILSAQTYISGAVSGVWDSTGNPYCVVDSTVIMTGDSLRIEPGVKLLFMGHHKFCVDSMANLKAIGTEEDSIYFTAYDTVLTDSAGGFSSIRFYGASPVCSLTYCDIRYGRADNDCDYFRGGGVFVQNSKVNITGCKITKCQTVDWYPDWGGAGIHVRDHSTCIIRNTTMTENKATNHGGAIKATASALIIENCIFSKNQALSGGGISANGCDTLIIRNC